MLGPPLRGFWQPKLLYQNFHFGTQVADSIHLIASFGTVQSKFISHLVEFQYLQDASNPPFCPYHAPEPGNSCCPTAGKETPSRPPSFLPQVFDPPPRPSSPQPVPPAHRSAAPCRQTAASSDGSPPASASSTGHVSPIPRPFSPAVAGYSST